MTLIPFGDIPCGEMDVWHVSFITDEKLSVSSLVMILVLDAQPAASDIFFKSAFFSPSDTLLTGFLAAVIFVGLIVMTSNLVLIT